VNFNEHSHLVGKHAFLSPSSYHWTNYNDQKLDARYISAVASARGVALHEYAQNAIILGIKQARTNNTLNMYINDAIGYKMTPEQVLFYSYNCFGCADTISFRKNFLRIHDLKTGITKSSFRQLEIYVALFCLEYGVSPFDIEIELRIYQSDDVLTHIPAPELILDIMDKIMHFDRRLELLKEGALDPGS
jgi:hypothetical protein